MSIQTKHIVKKFGSQHALNDVSFTIKKSEIVGFLGPNGAGKTTMMKIICGLLPQTSGEILVNETFIDESNPELKKQIGYLPEHNPLYPELYVKEYLSHIAAFYYPRKEVARQVKNIIEKTGLGIEQHKKIGSLSKGYKQRVGLAQAMIHHPEVLILDEPTSGLDPNQIIEIRNLIKESGKSKTVMLSTHILQEVEAICDRIIIINNGKIVADDTTENIMMNLKTPGQNIIVEFKTEVGHEIVKNIPGIDNAIKTGSCTWLLQSKKKEDIRGDIFSFAVKNELKIITLKEQENNLENIFHDLTKNE